MKLTNYDIASLDHAGQYYNDGLAILPIKNQEKLVACLNELLLSNTLKANYYWETVQNSHALRPHVYDYEACILDFLFDNSLPQKLTEYTERNLVLSHIQITKTDPGRSYQDWHRDSYQFGTNKWIGNTPPAHKIIFYPTLNEVAEPRLKFIRGSHRCMSDNPNIDSDIIRNFDNEIINSDNNKILMFDTSLLHGVIPDVNPSGSIRLIYNFITEKQYLKTYSTKLHHKNVHDIFLERLKEA